MPRVYLPLLPIPVLAAIVAFSACSASKSEEPAFRIIPPAAALAAAAPTPPAPPAAAPADDPPSEDENRAFEKPVPK